MTPLRAPGQAIFATTLAGLGLIGLVHGDFAPLWQQAPKDAHLREVLVYAGDLTALACGLGLLWPRTAVLAARVLLVWSLLWLFLCKAPAIVRHPALEVAWQSAGESAVIAAAAWALYVRFADSWDRRRLRPATGETGLRLARGLYAAAMIAFGLSHWVYAKLTASLVPALLPAHMALAYATGAAFLAAGAAMLTGVLGRPAAALSALQMGLFTLLVWVPLAAGGHADAGTWSELALSWALTTAGWVVAESYPRASGGAS